MLEEMVTSHCMECPNHEATVAYKEVYYGRDFKISQSVIQCVHHDDCFQLAKMIEEKYYDQARNR